MKYLKKFNEELSPRIYRSAARKLKDIDKERSDKLQAWAEETESREEMRKWKDKLQDYALFGTFKINIVNPDTEEKFTGDFYLDIDFDELTFQDSFDDDMSNSHSLFFFIGLIPTSEDTLRKCMEIMPAPEFGNGFFWGMTCGFDYRIERQQVKIEKFILDEYDYSLSGNVSFADRASANRFKTLLKNIFSDPELNYPSGYTDVEYMYQKLEQVICIEQSFSSDYGFELKDVADFINQISPNTMYKTI